MMRDLIKNRAINAVAHKRNTKARVNQAENRDGRALSRNKTRRPGF